MSSALTPFLIFLAYVWLLAGCSGLESRFAGTTDKSPGVVSAVWTNDSIGRSIRVVIRNEAGQSVFVHKHLLPYTVSNVPADAPQQLIGFREGHQLPITIGNGDLCEIKGGTSMVFVLWTQRLDENVELRLETKMSDSPKEFLSSNKRLVRRIIVSAGMSKGDTGCTEGTGHLGK